jgi:hypothetical protein
MAGKLRGRLIGSTMLGALALIPVGIQAQTVPNADSDVVVTGVRSKLSNWRQAETSHVILLSDGSEAELVRLARNLEWLHFLLSNLMGRGGADEDLVKIRITLIGEVAQFEQMNLRNIRWQQGPFNDLFQVGRYYDPREDGAVMASTRIDQRVVVEHTTVNAASVQGLLGSMAAAASSSDPQLAAGLQAAIGNIASQGIKDQNFAPTFGEKAMQVTAENLLYAGYAQHFLLTYFPAAYPRWYLDGFGQVFSTFTVIGNGGVEFGRAPNGADTVIQEFGSFPIKDVLNDAYLGQKPSRTRWTPIHAWMLTHFLLFSDERRPQLNQYLAARARGEEAEKAAAIFGDLTQLGSELRSYFFARKTFVKVTYDGSKIEQPLVRRLRESEAAFVKGRLELGTRVVIPPAPPADADPATAKAMTKAREEALLQRARWLERLRRDAARWSRELEAQLLLAEAECRSGNAAECLAAAERAEAIAPSDARRLVWKGTAMVMEAAGKSAPDRARLVAEARNLIVQANQADHEAVGPLLAFYRSFEAGGEPPSANAVDALAQVVAEVPAAPATRLELARTLAATGKTEAARKVILPVAAGAYDSPERPAANALLRSIGPSASIDVGGVIHAEAASGTGSHLTP